jgi:predicted dehydrogenase
MLGALVRDIDWLIWTFGGVRRVYAKRRRSRNAEIDPSDVCYVSIRMRSGVISHLTESLTPMRDESNFLEVAGRQGVLHLEEDESAKPIRSWIHGGSAGGRPDYSSASPLHSDARQECIRQFIHRMENDRASLENEDAGQQAMRVAFAALESIRTGQAIAFADEAESGEERTG